MLFGEKYLSFCENTIRYIEPYATAIARLNHPLIKKVYNEDM